MPQLTPHLRARSLFQRNATVLHALLACTAGLASAVAQIIPDWTSGAIPTSVINAGQTLNITTSNSHAYSATVTNSGTTNWQGGTLSSSGANFVNNAGATFNDTVTSSTSLSGAATFTNHGTYRKQGVGTTTVTQVFENNGAVIVSAGSLTFSGGGNATSSATYTVASGATLNFNSQTHTLAGGASFSGAGATNVNGGTLSLASGTVSFANLDLSFGTLGGAGAASIGALTQSGGTVSAGTLAINGASTWSGGNWNSGSASTATIASGATLTASGGGVKDFNFRTITNQGTFDFTGGQLRSGNGGGIVNAAGATFNDSAGGYITAGLGGTATFTNTGTYNKTTSALSDVQMAFASTGNITVSGGTLQLSGGGNATGNIAIADAARLKLTSANFEFGSGSVLNGPGAIEVSSATTAFAGTVTGNASLHVTGGTASITGTTTLGGATFSGGTFNGPGTLTLNNTLGLSGTTLTGAGTVNANGGVAITNSFSFNGTRSLNLSGSSTWSAGYIYAGGGSNLTIKPGATLTTSFDGTLNGVHYGGGAQSSIVDNQGTFVKSAGAGTTSVSAVFNNAGVVQVQSGTLELSNGGSHTGSVTLSPGATLSFNGGNHTLASGAQINGTGNLRVASGNATFSGATTGSANIVLSGGNAAFNGATTTTGGGTFSSGTLSGTGTLTLGNTVTLSGATLTGAGTLIASGGAVLTNSFSLNGTRTLTLGGSSTWNNGYIYAGDGTTLNNPAGATLTATGNSTLNGLHYGNATTVFNNQGNFTRSGADGRVELYATVNNTGTVRADTGTIDLRQGGTNTGTLAIASGATIDISSGNFALNPGTQLTGAGTLQLSGGTATVNATIASSGGGLFSGGALDGPGSLSFAGLLDLAGTKLLGTGTVTASGGASLTNGFDFKNGQTLTLAGESTWSAGSIYHGGSVTLNNTGNLTTTHNGGFYHYYGGTPLTFNNSGTFKKSTATGTTDLYALVNNTGTLAIETGTLSLRSGGTNSHIVNLSPGAQLAIDGGTFTFAPTSQILGTGTVLVSGGTAHFNGAATATAQLSLASGNATFTGNTSTSGGGTFSGGTLTGSGNVTFGAPLTLRGSVTLAGSGIVHAAGGASITESINLKDGQTLTLAGTSTWSGGTIYHGTGATLNNTGTLTHTHSGSFYHYFGGDKLTFNNSGTFTKNTSTGSSDLNATFVNTGTVNVDTGILDLSGGGSSSGPINLAPGATLAISGGLTVNNAAQLAGQGTLRLTGGTLTLTGSLGVTTFNLDGGRLAGSHTLTTTTNWNSGNWNATAAGFTTTIASGGTLNLSTGNNHDFNFRTIENLAGGTVTWQAGYLRSGNGGAFVNRGTFLDKNASSYSVYRPTDFGSVTDPANTFRFVNHGTYTRDVGGVTYFDVPFDNHGTLNLAGGEIRLNGGGTMAATSVVNASAGTHLYFTSDYTLAHGARFTGADAIIQSGGTLTIDGALNAPIFNWQGGNWNAATSGLTTHIASGTNLVLDSGGYKDFNRRNITIDAGGTVTWRSGYLRAGNGSVFTNDGTFLDRNSSSYSVHNPTEFGGSFRFVNRGTYTRDVGGVTYFDVPFDNQGRVNLTGGELRLQGGGTMSATSVVDVGTGARLYFSDNYTLEHGAQLTGLGSVIHDSGTLSINGALKAQSFNWTGGDWNASSPALTSIASGTLLTLDGGGYKDFNQRSITIDAGGTVDWQSGYLRGGNGSVFTNNGTFHDKNSSSYTVTSAVHSGLGGTFSFVNNGTYLRDVGGVTYFTAPFDNRGTLNLVSGSIELQGGGAMSATSVVNASPGARLYFESNYSIADGARFTGDGSFVHLSGTLAIDGTLQAPLFNWSGGNWNAVTSGLTTTIGSGSVLVIDGGGYKDFDRRSLAIAPGGTLIWQSGYLRSGNEGAIVNHGTFQDQNSSSYDIESPTASGLGGNFTFTNAGTYNKTTHGTTQVEIPFTNSGTLNLHAGTMTFLGAFTNSGAINLAAGAIANFPGALTFGATAPLGGTGTINASSVVAGGVVAPGNSAGKLTLTGTLTLLGTSSLLIELAGAGQGTGYDFLSVGGAATIAGNLQLSLLNGFRPALATDTFTVMSAASLTGAFANIANGSYLITSDGGGMFRVNYGSGSAFSANSVVLSDFQAIPEPSTYAMIGLGALVVIVSLRRRQRR